MRERSAAREMARGSGGAERRGGVGRGRERH